MAQGQLEAFEAFLKTRTSADEGHEVSIQFVPAMGSQAGDPRWIVTHYDTVGIFAKLKGTLTTRFFPWFSILQIL